MFHGDPLAEEMIDLHAQGLKIAEIADIFGTNHQHISAIIREYRRKDKADDWRFEMVNP